MGLGPNIWGTSSSRRGRRTGRRRAWTIAPWAVRRSGTAHLRWPNPAAVPCIAAIRLSVEYCIFVIVLCNPLCGKGFCAFLSSRKTIRYRCCCVCSASRRFIARNALGSIFGMVAMNCSMVAVSLRAHNHGVVCARTLAIGSGAIAAAQTMGTRRCRSG